MYPRSIVAYPVLFFCRRIIFAVSAVYLYDFLWGQLTIQMAVSLLMLVYLLIFKPMQSPFANRIEILNECTIVVLTYG